VANVVGRRDVFICFCKARPGEARVAIDLKDQLEQLGLFAFEYEDWKWIAAAVPGDEPDVDRQTLSHMLTTCSIVVLISPHSGAASAGVQTEIAELRSLGSPVILLHWSPEGWHPLLDPPELAGLNIVWSHEGRSDKGDVAQNQSEHIARQLAVASWIACHLRRAATGHPRTAARALAMIPEEPRDPLLNLRLARPEVEPDWADDPDLDTIAASVATDASIEDLRAFVHDWRDGSDLLAANLAHEAQFSLKRPVNTLYRVLEALCTHACDRKTELRDLSADTLERRGLMLVRLNRPEEALPVLKQALLTAPADRHYEIHQALALSQQDSDPAGAIDSFTRAIECAPTSDLASSITYSRGVIRSKAPSTRAAAIADFTFVIDDGSSATIRHSALRARAGLRADADDVDGAIADFTQILDDAAATPRTAVSAWMDRSAMYYRQGRMTEALADLTSAVRAADANPLQKFRSLEARAQLLEKLERGREAADDYESMTRFSSISRDYRAELTRTIARLRG
jgi:tetratricopeptide (TPR) repeat protein